MSSTEHVVEARRDPAGTETVHVYVDAVLRHTIDPVDGRVDTKSLDGALNSEGLRIRKLARRRSDEQLVTVTNELAGISVKWRVSADGSTMDKLESSPIADRPARPTSLPDPSRIAAPAPSTTSRTATRRNGQRPAPVKPPVAPPRTVPRLPEETPTVTGVPELEQSNPPAATKPAALKKVDNVRRKPARTSPVDTFKGWPLWKKAASSVAAIIVLFFLFQLFAGGGSDTYTGVCVDTRTSMRQLDNAPCTEGQVRFYEWYYVADGEKVPDVNTSYMNANGTFEKPDKGTINYS